MCSQLTKLLAPTRHRIALLVDGEGCGHRMEMAEFTELCAQNRGLPIRAFAEEHGAFEWLESGLKG